MKNKSGIWILSIAAIVLLITMVVKHFHVKNFNVVEKEVLYTSGQPKGMDYTRLLYKYHIATIVNLRSVSEHREINWYNEEITWTRENGVRYIELPIERSQLYADRETQNKFLKIMADKNNLPVLLHGSGGEKRVPMLTAVWLAKSKRMKADEIEKIVEKINGDRMVTPEDREFLKKLSPAQ